MNDILDVPYLYSLWVVVAWIRNFLKFSYAVKPKTMLNYQLSTTARAWINLLRKTRFSLLFREFKESLMFSSEMKLFVVSVVEIKRCRSCSDWKLKICRQRYRSHLSWAFGSSIIVVEHRVCDLPGRDRNDVVAVGSTRANDSIELMDNWLVVIGRAGFIRKPSRRRDSGREFDQRRITPGPQLSPARFPFGKRHSNLHSQ